MGQGQTNRALDRVADCAASGHWVYLSNVHLMSTWLPALEACLQGLQPVDGFRLWLSSEPCASFPTALLERSLVCAFEYWRQCQNACVWLEL